jgi:hypothetical protein
MPPEARSGPQIISLGHFTGNTRAATVHQDQARNGCSNPKTLERYRMPPDKTRRRPPAKGNGARTSSTSLNATIAQPSASRRPLLAAIAVPGPAPAAGSYRIADLPAAIARRITVHPVSGCWIVGGHLDEWGYARIGGRGAHRAIWELLEGPVLPGLVLDHREDWGCLSKACAFPGHLLPVTHRTNTTRPGAGGVAAVNIRKSRCGTCGQPYDLLNTYYKPDGHRDCRACIRRRVREYRQRLREAATAITRAELERAA